jgi:hypothetical protein
MKQLLGLVFLVLPLAGCGQATTPTPGTIPAGVSDIQVVIVTDDFAVGRPRLPFILYDGPQRVADVQRVTLTALDLSQEPPTPGWSGEATNYSNYVVPYWVAYPELPQPGFWGLATDITLADGTTTQAQFAIEVAEESLAPNVGEQPPASHNRTLETEPDIEKLTSDWEPEPALYQVSIAEAMASGRPTVVTFATPAFCQTQFCAPVVDSVKEVYLAYGDAVNFIHIEVYKEFSPELVLANEMTEWGFASEPWTYVLDSQGRVAGRFGGPVSPSELTDALENLLS